jgi:hypothetical protein
LTFPARAREPQKSFLALGGEIWWRDFGDLPKQQKKVKVDGLAGVLLKWSQVAVLCIQTTTN